MDNAGEDPVDQTQQQQETQETAQSSSSSSAGAPNPVDEDERKIFVGGLPQDCTDVQIREYFSSFGDVQGVNLKTDQFTGRSRGFCFVLFTSTEAVDRVNGQAAHEIMGKKVAIKKANAKEGKVYVGRVPKDITEDDLKAFFGTYGAVKAIEHPYDKIKGEKKNFLFVTFEREGPAKQLLKEGVVSVNGHEMDIKKVTPKPDGGMMGGGRGGGFGGGGGRGTGGIVVVPLGVTPIGGVGVDGRGTVGVGTVGVGTVAGRAGVAARPATTRSHMLAPRVSELGSWALEGGGACWYTVPGA